MDYTDLLNAQIQLANTAHQREVADLQAAGLNPVLSAGGSGAASPNILNGFDGSGTSAKAITAAGKSNPTNVAINALENVATSALSNRFHVREQNITGTPVGVTSGSANYRYGVSGNTTMREDLVNPGVFFNSASQALRTAGNVLPIIKPITTALAAVANYASRHSSEIAERNRSYTLNDALYSLSGR